MENLCCTYRRSILSLHIIPELHSGIVSYAPPELEQIARYKKMPSPTLGKGHWKLDPLLTKAWLTRQELLVSQELQERLYSAG